MKPIYENFANQFKILKATENLTNDSFDCCHANTFSGLINHCNGNIKTALDIADEREYDVVLIKR